MVEDLNNPSAPANGCGYLDLAIDENSQRNSTYHAFLPKKTALARKSLLKICTAAIVTRLYISQDENGKLKTHGVCFQTISSDSETYYAAAKREVILCSGAMGTPHLLLLM